LKFMKAQCRPSLCRSSRRRRKLTQSQLNRSRSPTKRKRTSRRCYDLHLVCATRLFCAKFLGRRAVYNHSISLGAFELGHEARILSPPSEAPAWRNWQTRWTQNPVLATVCGFEPLRRHSLCNTVYEEELIKKLQQAHFASSRTKTHGFALSLSTNG
jgi:hypothetical protein